MEKLNNWNAWCNDKVLLHSSEGGFPILVSPNAVLALEQCEGFTQLAVVDGLYFEVKETVEEILSIIGELIVESEARKKAQAEEQRKQYEDMVKAEKATKEASEG